MEKHEELKEDLRWINLFPGIGGLEYFWRIRKRDKKHYLPNLYRCGLLAAYNLALTIPLEIVHKSLDSLC